MTLGQLHYTSERNKMCNLFSSGRISRLNDVIRTKFKVKPKKGSVSDASLATGHHKKTLKIPQVCFRRTMVANWDRCETGVDLFIAGRVKRISPVVEFPDKSLEKAIKLNHQFSRSFAKLMNSIK